MSRCWCTSFVLQSTLRKPVVSNMKKALSLQYTVGLAIYYSVTIVGYWAYGGSVSEYLPKELSGPKWAKVLINSTAFLQSIVSQHVCFFYMYFVTLYSHVSQVRLVLKLYLFHEIRCLSCQYMRLWIPSS